MAMPGWDPDPSSLQGIPISLGSRAASCPSLFADVRSAKPCRRSCNSSSGPLKALKSLKIAPKSIKILQNHAISLDFS